MSKYNEELETQHAEKAAEIALNQQDGTHLGLRLIRERLLVYNEQNKNLILFEIASYENSRKQVMGTKAEIRIEQEKVIELVHQFN